ncbi:UNVERIFIED_CONTAM: hypothetical protein Sradi_2080200 [Sesamum radiatum]|uniref:DUF8040 domain-containing protein n=1 Tax=Sesamum radiatum TaxID=300843 RepID=A0AAW2TIE2_SESRA
MDRNTFGRLCYLLKHAGGLFPTKHLSVPEQVTIFLSVVSHHKKNCVVKYDFIRSNRTISRHFHCVLNTTLKLHTMFLAKSTPTSEGLLGALDGTYIDIRVPEHKKGRYRNWKGHCAVNVLDVCNSNMQFIYILTRWESSADSHVLRDAIHHQNDLRVSSGCVALAPNSMDPSFTSTEDEGSSRLPHRGGHKERSSTRRTWTLKEEEVLVHGLKMLVANGWKCDNDFHNGYLAHMSKAFLNCDLKAESHISPKTHVWERQLTARLRGCGLSQRLGIPRGPKSLVKTAPTETEGRTPTHMLLSYSILHKNITLLSLNGILKLGLLDRRRTPLSLNMNDDPTLNSSSASKKTGSTSQKRKVTDGNDPMLKLMDMFSSFCETANNRIGALTRVLETEFDDPEQRELILDVVRELNEFDENVHLKVAR